MDNFNPIEILYNNENIDIVKDADGNVVWTMFPPDNEIWYITTDGNPITLRSELKNVTSNTYDRFGKITFYSKKTEIESYAFQGIETLVAVKIPKATVTLNAQCFFNCSNLEYVTQTDNLTTVSASAFSSSKIHNVYITKNQTAAPANMPYLSFIKISSENTTFNDGNGSNCVIRNSDNELVLGCSNTVIPASVTTIYANAFWNNAMITDITIPSQINTVTGFSGCTNLSSVIIEEGVENIGSSAFSNTALKNISFPTSIQSIGSRAFLNSKLEYVDIHDNIQSLGDYCFSGCEELKSIKLPSTNITLDERLFSYCIKLNNVVIPDTFTYIPSEMFKGCTGLDNITLYNNIATLKSGAFANTGFSVFTLPSSVTSIESNVFQNLSNLKTFISLPTIPPTLNSQAFYFTSDFDIYVPDESVSAYQTASVWSKFAAYIKPISQKPTV